MLSVTIDINRGYAPREPSPEDYNYDDGRFSEAMKKYEKKLKEFNDREIAIHNMGLRTVILDLGD